MLLVKISTTDERTRDGNIKLSGPRISKKSTEDTKPVIAGNLYPLDFHCSTKRTTNKAVMEKSTPVKSNGIEPIRFPITEPILSLFTWERHRKRVVLTVHPGAPFVILNTR